MFWKKYEFNYPMLTKLARKILSAPASSSFSERAFSNFKLKLPPSRKRLNTATVKKSCICSQFYEEKCCLTWNQTLRRIMAKCVSYYLNQAVLISTYVLNKYKYVQVLRLVNFNRLKLKLTLKKIRQSHLLKREFLLNPLSKNSALSKWLFCLIFFSCWVLSLSFLLKPPELY